MDLIAHVLSKLDQIAKREAAARRERRLPPYHALTLDEFPFAFAVDDLRRLDEWCADQIAARGDIDILWYGRAIAGQALRDYEAANTAMEHWQRLAPDQPEATLRFGETPAPAQIALPPVMGSYPKRGGIFVGCDRHYFRSFATPLLRSIAAHAPGIPIHIHLMSPDLSCLDPVKNVPIELSVTYEDCEEFSAQHGIPANHYYGVARLIRFAEAVQTSDRGLWLTDADALAVRSVRPLLDLPERFSLQVRPGRIEPWHQFSACLVQGSRRSAGYFQRVADILLAALPKLWWGIDQHALLSAYVALRPPISLIGPDIMSVRECNPAAMLWYDHGTKKWDVQTNAGPYGTLFRHYFNQTSTPTEPNVS